MSATGASRDRSQTSGPDDPTDLSKGSWLDTIKRAGKEFQKDNATDWAAALTYYSVLSLFPGLLVLVAVLGVFGQNPETTNAMLDIFRDLGANSAADTLEEPIRNVTESEGGAGALLGVGLLGAVWSASGYLGAFSRASNAVYEVEEGRPFWKLRPQQVGMTILMITLLSLLLVGLVVTGPVAESIGNVVGVGDSAVSAWGIAKWPVMILIVAFMFAVLYYWAPNVKQPKFRWITPGSLFAVVAWILASGLFGFYVSNFGSYNATYGAFAGVIVFLLWIWITNLAILLGQEINAELERQREIE
ncbi:MAG: YihY/virulence factor BrkB family protein, partial [Solirubrobacterales bacterium]